MKRAIFVVVIAVFVCAQFAYAQAGLGTLRPLVNITQADLDKTQAEVDALSPDYLLPQGELPSDEYRYWTGLNQLAINQAFPVWSPDGDAVYLAAFNSIWRVPVSTGQPEMVIDFYKQEEGNYYHCGPVYTFNFMTGSNELLYSTHNLGEDGVLDLSVGYYLWALYALDVETGHKMEVACDVGNRVYSASGRYYADLNWDSEMGPLYIVDTITDNVIEFPCSFATFAFTPNERYLIAVLDGDETGIVQISLETGEHTVLVDDSDPETRPRSLNGITNNGEWVIYSRLHSIDVFNLYTGETGRLLSLKEDERIASVGDLSPDNKTIAFSMSKYTDRQQSTDIDGTKVYLLDIDLPLGDYDEYPLAVADESPASFTLLGNYPNPFNPTTTIGFTLHEPGSVNLTVYSVTGQAIRELVSKDMVPGRHSVVWDGCDDMGNQVAAGVYISRLTAGGQSVSGRMTLVK